MANQRLEQALKRFDYLELARISMEVDDGKQTDSSQGEN